MIGHKWSKEEARGIVKRVIVEGDLVLQTPAHLGNGDGDEVTDMPLLVDAVDGKSPLLTGASIAGALRSYLRTREAGYGQALPKADDEVSQQDERKHAAVKLFGGFRADDWGEQSALIVEDARGTIPIDPATKKPIGVEVRDGVKIASRTAEEDKLYDVRLWPAGTHFVLRCELLIRRHEHDDETELKQALAAALTGLTDGGITLGARKRRGYGQVRVTQWRKREFDLLKPDELCLWISEGNRVLDQQKHGMASLTEWGAGSFVDLREMFEIAAEFSLPDSMLIRSGGGRDDTGPDMAHLKSYRPEHKGEVPILSGTSLAGALRARALKIANTIKPGQAAVLIDGLFGTTSQASRVIVEEQEITKANVDLVQSRVSIDRFTGGARDTALFNEQPAFGGKETTLRMKVRLVNPQDHEIGLLLLLLKDLWTSDLPLGGESSVGRGRLIGQRADLTWRKGQIQAWRVEEQDQNHPGKLMVTKKQGEPRDDPRSELNTFVKKLNEYQPEVQHEA